MNYVDLCVLCFWSTLFLGSVVSPEALSRLLPKRRLLFRVFFPQWVTLYTLAISRLFNHRQKSAYHDSCVVNSSDSTLCSVKAAPSTTNVQISLNTNVVCHYGNARYEYALPSTPSPWRLGQLLPDLICFPTRGIHFLPTSQLVIHAGGCHVV
jgi:hypothetical protein